MLQCVLLAGILFLQGPNERDKDSVAIRVDQIHTISTVSTNANDSVSIRTETEEVRLKPGVTVTEVMSALGACPAVESGS